MSAFNATRPSLSFWLLLSCILAVTGIAAGEIAPHAVVAAIILLPGSAVAIASRTPSLLERRRVSSVYLAHSGSGPGPSACRILPAVDPLPRDPRRDSHGLGGRPGLGRGAYSFDQRTVPPAPTTCREPERGAPSGKIGPGICPSHRRISAVGLDPVPRHAEQQ